MWGNVSVQVYESTDGLCMMDILVLRTREGL